MDHPAQGGVATAGGGRGCARHRLEGHFPFVGSTKRILRRVLRESGVVLAPEAQARLDALPGHFLDFITAPERFAEQPVAEAA